ncbi:MAG TPA: hypothetical protein VHC47_00425 [Mucilaginibacter sp.]|nr:hypothetical protein [Mucilaginibacter sp.]
MKKLLLIIVLYTNTSFAQQMIRSGTVYSEHPYIGVVKRFASEYWQVNPADMAQLYAADAQFFGLAGVPADTPRLSHGLPPKGSSLNEAIKSWQQMTDNWQNIKMTLAAPPQGYGYNDSPDFVVESHWIIGLTNKNTKKNAYIDLLLIDEFNDAGKIAVERQYYDASPLLAAAK